MRAGVLSTAALSLLLACGDGGNVIGPGNQLEVTNAPDDFQFQVSNLSDVRQTLRYTWTNTGDSANVNQASALTEGEATVTIRGPNGVVVYQASLGNNGTFHTLKSASGGWSIDVALERAHGAVNFRVQKAP